MSANGSDSHADPSRLGAALAAIASMAVVLLGSVGLGRADEVLPGLAFDACAVLAVWLSAELLARAGMRPAWAGAVFYPPLLAICALVFAHAWFFDVAVERRLTVLDLTWGGLAHFFRVALPPRGLLGLLAICASVAAGASVAARYVSWRRSSALPFALAALVVSGPLALRAERVPSPLFDSALELWEAAVRPKVAASSAPSAPRYLGLLDKSARSRAAAGVPVRYDKVIVLVMETMTAQAFTRESARLPPDTFVRRERAHMHHFERYFPNNQDSRTGMLDMLFSRLIPYDAYSDEGVRGYAHLAERPSLVDRMRELSYASAFAVAQTALEEVVRDLSWDAALALDEAQIRAARERDQLCFSPDVYEQSCEDLVLLPAVVEFVAAHERAFVYQEFIWGHAAEYNDASGKSNAEYYSRYVDALLEALAARGVAARTLIALTSDHGFRDKGRQHEPEVYRIPLLFHAPGLAARSDGRLLSHTDFGMLLLEELVPGAPPADDNPFVLIVGPTGQGHLFAIGHGGHLLLRRKLGLELMVAREGQLPLGPSELVTLFADYRRAFAGR